MGAAALGTGARGLWELVVAPRLSTGSATGMRQEPWQGGCTGCHVGAGCVVLCGCMGAMRVHGVPCGWWVRGAGWMCGAVQALGARCPAVPVALWMRGAMRALGASSGLPLLPPNECPIPPLPEQHQLEAALLGLGQFQHQLEELLQWLSRTAEQLQGPTLLRLDLQSCEIELAKHKVRVAAGRGCLHAVSQAARLLPWPSAACSDSQASSWGRPPWGGTWTWHSPAASHCTGGPNRGPPAAGPHPGRRVLPGPLPGGSAPSSRRCHRAPGQQRPSQAGCGLGRVA